MSEQFETIIIGAGQTGLALGYHLQQRGRPFVILEAGERVGDHWRRRYDSLRLYTPARFDTLPGCELPIGDWEFPTKDELADYLESYARRFELPVVTGVTVDSLRREGERYVVRAGPHRFEADNVVVASGSFNVPKRPQFASELGPSIRQLHSDDYRNPSQLRDGPTLVVGCSHSGSDIALEVAAAGRPTVLSGRVHGEIPFVLESRVGRRALPLLWFVWNRVLTMKTPMGRRLRPRIRGGGGPLLRVRRSDLAAAGVERTDARVADVRDGRPLLDDGRVLDVANVVWCTGFTKDVSWIEFPVLGEDGWPEQERGAVAAYPGLYFLGLLFQYSFASMLVGGAGPDAEQVARHIAARAEQAGALPASGRVGALV